jgi:hypothetical protein
MGGEAENTEGPSFQKGSDNDISNGPIQKRGCTDIVCLLLFLLHWVGFVGVTVLGFQDGNPTKLYKPRDFRGDYCGVEKQWNDGLVLTAQPKLTYTMNVTRAVDLIAKQLVCSTAAENALSQIMTVSQLSAYRCACCKSACASCYGSLALGDLTSDASLKSTISGKMGGLTGASGAGSLFSPSGAMVITSATCGVRQLPFSIRSAWRNATTLHS